MQKLVLKIKTVLNSLIPSKYSKKIVITLLVIICCVFFYNIYWADFGIGRIIKVNPKQLQTTQSLEKNASAENKENNKEELVTKLTECSNAFDKCDRDLDKYYYIPLDNTPVEKRNIYKIIYLDKGNIYYKTYDITIPWYDEEKEQILIDENDEVADFVVINNKIFYSLITSDSTNIDPGNSLGLNLYSYDLIDKSKAVIIEQPDEESIISLKVINKKIYYSNDTVRYYDPGTNQVVLVLDKQSKDKNDKRCYTYEINSVSPSGRYAIIKEGCWEWSLTAILDLTNKTIMGETLEDSHVGGGTKYVSFPDDFSVIGYEDVPAGGYFEGTLPESMTKINLYDLNGKIIREYAKVPWGTQLIYGNRAYIKIGALDPTNAYYDEDHTYYFHSIEKNKTLIYTQLLPKNYLYIDPTINRLWLVVDGDLDPKKTNNASPYIIAENVNKFVILD